MKIRKFKDSDAVAVARLHRNTIRMVNKEDYSKKQIAEWSSRITAHWYRESSTITRFVAIDNEKIIGVCGYRGNNLFQLYVKPSFIRSGTGKKLLNYVENYAGKNGVKYFKLTSTKTAKSFYEKQRYKLIKKTTCDIDGFLLPGYAMRKRL